MASYPFDLLRTTLAAQGEPKVCCDRYVWVCDWLLVGTHLETHTHALRLLATHPTQLYTHTRFTSCLLSNTHPSVLHTGIQGHVPGWQGNLQ